MDSTQSGFASDAMTDSVLSADNGDVRRTNMYQKHVSVQDPLTYVVLDELVGIQANNIFTLVLFK